MDDNDIARQIDPAMSRRTLMGLSATAVAGVTLAAHLTPAAASPPVAGAGEQLALVAPYDPATLDRSQFERHEQRLARYLVTLPDLANKMDTENEETYGFLTGGYWRTPLVPYNANIQQSVYTMSWFYANERVWNPYYLDPALRDRIYAAIRYYISLQGEDGWFPAWSYVDRNRDVTAYALVFLGETALIHEQLGWPDDGGLRDEVIDALVRAAEHMLDPGNGDVWNIGTEFSNQVIPALMGVWMLRDLMPRKIMRAYAERMDYFVEHAQSEGTGYLYENAGFDGHYSLYVTTRMFARMYDMGGDRRLKAMELKHLDWCSYNYLWEPDGAGFTVNGISTRLSMRSLSAVRGTDESSYPDLLNVFSRHSKVATALNWHREHVEEMHDAWAADDEPLTTMGNPVDPMNIWYAERRDQRLPTYRERMRAIESFPYFGRSFVEARSDERHDLHYVFTNRPSYYFATHHGNAPRGRVVPKGPSFFYHHSTGAFVATQMGTESTWSTRLPGGIGDATMRVVQLKGEYHERQAFEYTYYASRPSGGLVAKTFRCGDDAVTIDIGTDADAFTERVPLVVAPGDELSWILADGSTQPASAGDTVTAAGIRVTREGGDFALRLAEPLEMSLTATGTKLFSGAAARVIHDLDIAVDSADLSYTLGIDLR